MGQPSKLPQAPPSRHPASPRGGGASRLLAAGHSWRDRQATPPFPPKEGVPTSVPAGALAVGMLPASSSQTLALLAFSWAQRGKGLPPFPGEVPYQAPGSSRPFVKPQQEASPLTCSSDTSAEACAGPVAGPWPSCWRSGWPWPVGWTAAGGQDTGPPQAGPRTSWSRRVPQPGRARGGGTVPTGLVASLEWSQPPLYRGAFPCSSRQVGTPGRALCPTPLYLPGKAGT